MGLYSYINEQERETILQAQTNQVELKPTDDDYSIQQQQEESKVDDIKPTTTDPYESSSSLDDGPFHQPTKHKNNNTTTTFVLDPATEFSPQIVWLMSFPNSGTSYTMTMVSRSTNRAFATNYADEVLSTEQTDSLSIYPNRKEGPFWAGKSGLVATPRDLPDHYVITKTHCGSRCMHCGPDQYVESPTVFLDRCRTGHSRVDGKRRDVIYPASRVQKAIHLIRNPMHNIIARYHLEHRHKGYKNNTDWLEQHSNDVEGVQTYCHDSDQTYYTQDVAYFGSSNIPKAPCHGEFFKWTQWHNLALESLDIMSKEKGDGERIPVLTVYYEDYKTRFNETVGEILDFLDLSVEGYLREFTSRSDYDGYFTKDQLKEIRKLVKETASSRTWEQVKHYF